MFFALCRKNSQVFRCLAKLQGHLTPKKPPDRWNSCIYWITVFFLFCSRETGQVPLLLLCRIHYKLGWARRGPRPGLGPTYCKYLDRILSKRLNIFSKLLHALKNWQRVWQIIKHISICEKYALLKHANLWSVHLLCIPERNVYLFEFFQQVLCNRILRAHWSFRLVNTCSHYFYYS